jgi:hypothetical protein
MTEEQKDKYVELLEAFMDAVRAERRRRAGGWTMAELKALQSIQDFEDTLPCNQLEGEMQ